MLLAVAGASVAGPFEQVDALDTTLVRGQSTRDEVRALLGRPDGKGLARFPPAWAPQEIWFYQEQKVHSSQLNPDIRDGKLEADAEERTLHVFFTGDRFDGYLWYGFRTAAEQLP